MKRNAYLVLFAWVLLLPLKGLSQKAINVIVGPGPEDMAIDSSVHPPRLIVSCSERRKDQPEFGEFYAVDLESLDTLRLVRTGEPDNWQLHLHGIDVVTDVNGRTMLYAISHGLNTGDDTHTILVYEVLEHSLNYLFMLQDKKFLKSPNDLTATSDGRIFVSNDYGGGITMLFRFIFKTKASKIAAYESGEWNFAAKGFRYANGIKVHREQLFLTTTAGGRLFRFDIKEEGLGPKTLIAKKLKGLDNISFTAGGELLIPAHPSNSKFLKHVKNADSPSPTQVYKVNPKDGSAEMIYEEEGEGISAGSTAVIHNSRLIICQVFNNYIRIIPIPKI